MKNKKRYILIGIIITIMVVSVSTYAWLSWRSNDTAMVLTIGEVGSINITLSPYKFNSSIDPTITYDGNDYVSVTAKNESSEDYKTKLYYKINDIPEELIDSTFKYTILRSSDGATFTEYDEGNFSNAANGSEYIILDEEKIKSGEVKYYRVYLWIEGSVTDNTGMQGKVFNAELRADYERVDGIESLTYEEISSNYSCLVDGETFSIGEPIFTYTGECEVVDDSDGNWKVRFLSDGTFITTEDMIIDAFLVGGGGGGATGSTLYTGGGGGAGGYTNQTTTFVKKEQNYDIKIGAGGTAATDGEDTTAFGAIAAGGSSGFGSRGGTGGSGGGDGEWSNEDGPEYNGGSDGTSGSSYDGYGGNGQETTTCEFGIVNCTSTLLYAGGGGGGSGIGANGVRGTGGIGGSGGGADSCQSALDNTGGGGGGGGAKSGCDAGVGGSGIVIIRNVRSDESIDELPSVGFDFEYTGNYLIINDGNDNWRIKFLTSGTFTSLVDLQIDAFLVGGGGGGGNGDTLYTGGGGGGSGYTKTITKINIEKNKDYNIIIGSGGPANTDGESSIAFEQEALGGSKGITGGDGGNGGSGGGIGQWSNDGDIGNGGSDGSDGNLGGTGQGSTTCEFGIENCDIDMLYAGGGAGGAGKSANIYGGTPGIGGVRGGGHGGPTGEYTYTYVNGSHAVTNTGSGGGGGGVKGSNGSSVAGVGGSGGSGIVIIRNAR